MAIANRFVASIDKKEPFAAADFLRPLDQGDTLLLQRLSECKVDNVGHPMLPAPNARDNVYVEIPDEVSIIWSCKGVSNDNPVGVSLKFLDGRIAKISTHNFDLMRAD